LIDIKKLKYKVVLLSSDGQPTDLTPVLEGLDWEENDGELAAKATVELTNVKLAGTYVSTMAKLGAILFIYANATGQDAEVFRGKIYNWAYKKSDKKNLTLTVYDALYPLQKSRDNRYYKAGSTAKSMIIDIFKSWSVPIGSIEGPDIAIGKKVFRSAYLSDMTLEILDDAKKKGGGKYIVKSRAGTVNVVKRGSNAEVYTFDEEQNAFAVGDQLSIENLVTRVKVIGERQATSDANPVVQAVVDGKTDFGILQELYQRGGDETIEAAKKAAGDIISERGKPERTITVQLPDIPFIRKGDKVKIRAATLDGFFFVKSIQHDASKKTMAMEVEPYE